MKLNLVFLRVASPGQLYLMPELGFFDSVGLEIFIRILTNVMV